MSSGEWNITNDSGLYPPDSYGNWIAPFTGYNISTASTVSPVTVPYSGWYSGTTTTLPVNFAPVLPTTEAMRMETLARIALIWERHPEKQLTELLWIFTGGVARDEDFLNSLEAHW